MRSYALILVLFISACGSVAAPSGVGAPLVSASSENAGVKLTLELDRASIRPGEVVWATLTVENTNARRVRSVAYGCATAGRVISRMAPVYDFGRSWPEYLLADVKKRTVLSGPFSTTSWLDQQSWMRATQGRPPCRDEAKNLELPAHTTIRSYFAWDGMVSASLEAPTGAVDIVAEFYMDDEQRMVGMSVSSTARLQIIDGSPIRVSPGRAFDAALDEGSLARWLRERAKPDAYGQQTAHDVEGSLRIDGDSWVIDVVRATAPSDPRPGGGIVVRVDGRTGVVTSVAQRP